MLSRAAEREKLPIIIDAVSDTQRIKLHGEDLLTSAVSVQGDGLAQHYTIYFVTKPINSGNYLSGGAFESGLHSTSILNRALGPASGSATLIRTFPDPLSQIFSRTLTKLALTQKATRFTSKLRRRTPNLRTLRLPETQT
jgi:hypothetical protein